MLDELIYPETNQLLRRQLIKEDFWFHASDVCQILGLNNPSQTISPLLDENKRKIATGSGSAPWYIDEEGLYTILLRCQGALDPNSLAFRFRKWVISVIKNIRKYKGHIEENATAEEVQVLLSNHAILVQRKAKESEVSALIDTLPSGSPKIPALARELTLRKALRKDAEREVKKEEIVAKKEAEKIFKQERVVNPFSKKVLNFAIAQSEPFTIMQLMCKIERLQRGNARKILNDLQAKGIVRAIARKKDTGETLWQTVPQQLEEGAV